ncbi:hypothetical protein VTK56DRAFT_6771 [Thermocarpiscus australiensis]
MKPASLYEQVREHYSSASRTTSVKYGETVAKSFGYSAEELASIPQGANLGLSCGNPLAIASLKEGETVIDLGSGAGFDVFLAAKKVGPSGRAIGVDMNDDMLARANRIKASQQPAPAATTDDNITFVKGNITSVPLGDSTADCIISNCVINLVPRRDKPAVFREMHRLLRPGGRVAVSDILAKKELPERLRADVALYVGCIAGASTVGEYEAWLKDAGFEGAMIVDTGADLNVYLETGPDGKKKGTCCGKTGAAAEDGECPPELMAGCSKSKSADATASGNGSCVPGDVAPVKTDLNEFVGSYKIFAVKK